MAGKNRNTLTTIKSKGDVALHDMNRAKQLRDSSQNRLLKDVTQIESQEVSSMVSIKRDQKLLKEKLDSVRQSTGYFAENNKSTSGLRRKSPRRNISGDLAFTGIRMEHQKLPRLPSLVITDSEIDKPNNIEGKIDGRTKATRFKLKHRSSSLDEETKSAIPKQTFNLPEMSKLSKSESTLNNASWYTNLDDVRSAINQRLSISMNELDNSNSESGLEPYLYAPPDGLPRTMYLMPSMEERFKQAMKARYIRKPGTRIDPIERELNLDEIFDPKKTKK